MSRVVIGLAGLPGAGKSAAADRLINTHGFTREKFSGPLKDMVRALGFTEDEIEGELKDKPSDKLTMTAFMDLAEKAPKAFKAIGVEVIDETEVDPIDKLGGRTPPFAFLSFLGILSQAVARGEKDGGATPRLLMQLIGTEWGRAQISPTLWIDLWRSRVDELGPDAQVVVDDCRFSNEVSVVHDVTPFSVVARIARPGTEATNGHVAELQTFKVDVTINNDGTLDELLQKVDSLVIKNVEESPSIMLPSDVEMAAN